MLSGIKLCNCVCFRNYFERERSEIRSVFMSGESNVMIAIRGLPYTLRVPDLNVERVVFYDMPAFSHFQCYMRLRDECGNVVATSTYVVTRRDRRVALAIAQHIDNVSIEHFV